MRNVFILTVISILIPGLIGVIDIFASERPAPGRWSGDLICFNISKDGRKITVSKDGCDLYGMKASLTFGPIRIPGNTVKLCLNSSLNIIQGRFNGTVTGGKCYIKITGVIDSPTTATGTYRIFHKNGKEFSSGDWDATAENDDFDEYYEEDYEDEFEDGFDDEDDEDFDDEDDF